MRILVADDDNISRKILEAVLAKSGYEVISKKDGQEAFEALKGADSPRIAILDWFMPEMLGIEVCRKVREIESRTPPYIILLTSKDGKQDIVTGLDAGADDYMTKPFEREELKARIKVGERVVKMQQALFKQVQELKESREEAIKALADLKQEVKTREGVENELRESEEKYRNILENIEEGYYEVDLAGNFTFVNNSTCKRLGYPKKELIGMNNRNYMDQETAKSVYQTFNKVYTTGVSSKGFEYEFIRKDGARTTIELSVSLIRDSKGKPVGFRGVSRDISERRKMELELIQARKLESVGQLAAGIAHEINTPTQFVGDNITFLKEATEDIFALQEKQGLLLEAAKTGSVTNEIINAVESALEEADVEYLKEEIPKAVDQSLDGVARVSKIVRAMKEFSHPGANNMTVADINEAIETTITVARNEWKYVAEMKTHFDANLPEVPCLVSEFNQVILNLVINAAHAIKDVVGESGNEMGTITISTARNENWAEVRVGDTGTGIPKQNRDKVFDPFFTTKEVGKGTGQGLAMAYNVIVDKHHGTLSLETEEGTGTTFIIRLPLVADNDGQKK